MGVYYYIQTNLICVILLVGIWSAIHNRKGARPAEQVALVRIILLTVVLSLSDMFAWICMGQTWRGADIVLHAVNMLYFASTTAVCYGWTYYIYIQIYGREKTQRKRMLLTALPFLAMLALIAVNPFTGLLFRIDEQNVYTRGSFVALHWIVNIGYIVYGVILTTVHILRKKTRLERRQYVPLLWFFVMPCIGAAVQIFFYGTTTIQCGITLSVMLHAYVTLQAQISGDSLTGLNNRRALDNYLNAQMQRGVKSLSVIMCDIDDFKKINDTLGHAHGDIALKRASNILRKACGRCGVSVFLCRFGGDEFVICSTALEESGLVSLTAAIREEIAHDNEENPDDVALTFSLGTACGACSGDADAEALLKSADEAMYTDKKSRGAGRK